MTDLIDQLKELEGKAKHPRTIAVVRRELHNLLPTIIEKLERLEDLEKKP